MDHLVVVVEVQEEVMVGKVEEVLEDKGGVVTP